MSDTSEITMPRLSDSMEEGTILKWLFADGESVARGDELVEIETDKATVVHSAEAGGRLEIIAPEGATLPVGAPIARVGASVPASGANGAAPSNGDASVSRADAATSAADLQPSPTAAASDVSSISEAPAATTLLATPLARRVAHAHDIPLERIAGSGPRGRITRADVLDAAGVERSPAGPSLTRAPRASPSPADSQARTQSAAVTTGAASARGETLRVEPSRQQRQIARRMAEAKATIPHFQVQAEVAMDAVLGLRRDLKQSAAEQTVPSLNDLIVKACALALREHPRGNGSYTDGGFELHSRINVGVAVASEDALLVPVVMDADKKSLGAIARETKRLAERVRTGEISPPELSGATFTVSNLGMFGMSAITPVVNPPQAAILGVGALRETLARVDGEIVDRTLLTLTLSCDHRILYGADAAWLLSDIRARLEKPLALLL
jgi:pyruvate dehydrogenase E2 component (dihydrolipoamide acetyltransferase)